MRLELSAYDAIDLGEWLLKRANRQFRLGRNRYASASSQWANGRQADEMVDMGQALMCRTEEDALETK